MTTTEPAGSRSRLPGALRIVLALEIMASGIAVLELWLLTFRGGATVHRPLWLRPEGRAVVVVALLAVLYGGAAWLLARRRWSGYWLATALAVAGLAWVAAIGGTGLVINVGTLVLLNLPQVRATLRR